MQTTTSTRPRRADAARNRERILAAASELFAERGLDASMPELAERAGVGVGTVYRAFPDKEHVLSEKTLHMRVDYSPFEGQEVVGAPTHVLSRGKVIVEHGHYVGKKGDGRFIKRATFGL